MDPDPFYASLAAGALERIGSVAALLEALSGEAVDPGLAATVAEAIGRLGPAASAAESKLRGLAACASEAASGRSEDVLWDWDRVREMAEEALRRIGAASTDESGIL